MTNSIFLGYPSLAITKAIERRFIDEHGLKFVEAYVSDEWTFSDGIDHDISWSMHYDPNDDRNILFIVIVDGDEVFAKSVPNDSNCQDIYNSLDYLEFTNYNGESTTATRGNVPAHYEVIATGQKFNTLADYIKQMETTI